jgi:hypothetical protein
MKARNSPLRLKCSISSGVVMYSGYLYLQDGGRRERRGTGGYGIGLTLVLTHVLSFFEVGFLHTKAQTIAVTLVVVYHLNCHII